MKPWGCRSILRWPIKGAGGGCGVKAVKDNCFSSMVVNTH